MCKAIDYYCINVFCDKLRLNQILLNLMSNASRLDNERKGSGCDIVLFQAAVYVGASGGADHNAQKESKSTYPIGVRPCVQLIREDLRRYPGNTETGKCRKSLQYWAFEKNYKTYMEL